MKNLGTQRGNKNASRLQDMERRISGIEDTIEEMNILIKENVKAKYSWNRAPRKSRIL